MAENFRDRSTDLRELIIADDSFSDISDYESDIEKLLDFSSGSDDNFRPREEFDSDDSRAEDSPGPSRPRPTPTFHRARPEILNLPSTSGLPLPPSSPRPSSPQPSSPSSSSTPPSSPPPAQPWVRVYPPEAPIDISSFFTVRNPGARDCPIHHEPVEYFKLFVGDGLLNVIVRETNAYASRMSEKRRSSGTLRPHSRVLDWKNVSNEEMRKFMAIVFYMGLAQKKNIEDYWSSDPIDFQPWFSQTMSLRRFQAINAYLHLTSRQNIPKGQPGYDPWVKIRVMLDAVNSSFKRHYVPDQNLSLDESMIGMKNRCAFIQYMPNKRHARYGIKKFELVDSKTSYVIHTALYSGKDYLADRNENFTHKVVIDLLEKGQCLEKGYQVFTDNFYTKLPLVQELLDKGTYLTGTVNKRTKDLPANVVQAALGPEESIYYRRGDILLVGYKQKPTRKPVYLLSTGCHAEDVQIRNRRTLRQAKKPKVIDCYNQFMGGIDNKDKIIFHYSCTRPVRRYWKKIFYNILDMSMSNAYIIYAFQCQPVAPMSRRKFILEVIRSLATTVQPALPIPGPAGDQTPGIQGHALAHLPGSQRRVCVACPNSKKRSPYWCPGCNSGVHKECFITMDHRYRPTKSKRKMESASDSD